MAFDNQISTTIEGAFQDLRDKVSGMTGWGLIEDNIGSGYVVFSTPHTEEVFVGCSALNGWVNLSKSTDDYNSSDYLKIETGQNWDESNQSFGSSGVSDAGQADDENNYGTYNAANNPTADAEYWLGYTADRGFCFYLRRNQGDGQDLSGAVGYGLWETEFWDFDSADTKQGGYNGEGMIGAVGMRSSSMGYVSQNLTRRYGGDGVLNPDSAFNNYLWDRCVFYYSPASNSDTGRSPNAARAYPVWIRDQSGTSVNSGDVVQSSSGGDEYMILNYNGARCAISME